MCEFYKPLTMRYIIVSILILLTSIYTISGQQIPLLPVSIKVFNPFIFNPAISGSKDFASLDLLVSNYGKSGAQVICGNFRVSKPHNEYFSAVPTTEFKRIGLGAYLFNEKNGMLHNFGMGASASYHIQLDRNALSYLSFGVSAKALSIEYTGNPDLDIPSNKAFFPDVDAGLYYYNPCFFAGISATNVLGNQKKTDNLGLFTIPIPPQFFIQAGYKIVLSRSKRLILEPSLIVNTYDTIPGNKSEMFKPCLKVYAGNFCLGTYFNDFSKISFFMQYKYPKFYLATYFELPQNSPYFKKEILAEIGVGFNLSAIKSGFSRENHW